MHLNYIKSSLYDVYLTCQYIKDIRKQVKTKKFMPKEWKEK
jgi:hypothetical protein